MPADTFASETTVGLFANAVNPPGAPGLSVLAGDNGIGVSILPPSSVTGQARITGYDIYRDDNPAQPIHTQTGTTLWVDPLPSGEAHTYWAVADSDVGAGPASQSLSATSLAPVAAVGDVNAYTTDITTAGGDTPSSVDTPTLGPVSGASVTFVGSQPNTSLTIGTTVNGQRLVPGTYTAPDVPTIESSWVSSCTTMSVDVAEADIEADGTPDVLSGDYVQDCGNGERLTGVFRWHSTAGFVAVKTAPVPADAGPVLVGQSHAVPTVTVTDTGTLPLRLGVASLGGTDAQDFALAQDACSGATVQPGSSCTIQLVFTPAAAGVRAAVVTLPDNTTAGERRVTVVGTGAVVPGDVSNPYALPGAGHVQVHWGDPHDNGGAPVTAYQIFRGASADSLSTAPVATVPGNAYEWVDHGVTAGSSYVYGVVAVNIVGAGPMSTTARVAALSRELVYSQWNGSLYALVASDLQGGPTTVLDAGADTGEAAVSPDGKWVAYVRGESGAGPIWVVPVDGSAAPRELTFGASDEYPAWSPDSTHIAYDYSSGSVSYVATVPAAGGARTLVGGASYAYRPSYTPSGRELVVGNQAGGVDVIGLDGSGRRHVTGAANGFDPQISPDGTRIAFISYGASLTDACGDPYVTGHVVTVPTIGGTPSTVLGSADSFFDPSWSPDGGSIAVSHFVLTDGCLGNAVTNLVHVADSTLLGTVAGDAFDGGVHDASASPRPVTPPAAPGSLSATLAHGTVTLRWSPPADKDLWKIVVRRSAAGGSAPKTPGDGTAVATAANSAKAGGLTDGKVYTFSVFAIDTAGTVSRAAVRSAVPMAAPTLGSSTAPSGPMFTVAWHVTGAASYDVLYARGTGSLRTWKSRTTVAAAVFGASGRPVRPTTGSTWTFVARAHDKYGNLTAWTSRRSVRAS